MPTKTYVLLEHMNADAPVYIQTGNNQREKITKIPFHRPTLRQQFYDENGNSIVIRYKSASKFIDQWKQIEEEKIPANEPFSRTEYNDLNFRHAILVTNKVRAQEYLESHPECEGFKGTCDDVRQPKYKLLDNAVETKVKNNDIRLRVRAANKVLGLGLEAAQEMLIRINGSFFKTPDDVEECQNMLMAFIDDSEEAGLKAVLQEEEDTNIDDKTTVLIGKLINAGLLSFDAVEGKVSKKDKNGEWITVRDLSPEYSLDERKRLFSNFLNTAEGNPLKVDLENDLRSNMTKTEDTAEQPKRMGRPPKSNN